jgi:hypothetical protein
MRLILVLLAINFILQRGNTARGQCIYNSHAAAMGLISALSLLFHQNIYDGIYLVNQKFTHFKNFVNIDIYRYFLYEYEYTNNDVSSQRADRKKYTDHFFLINFSTM